MRWLLGQISSFFGYLLLPFACFLLPAGPAAAMTRRVSRWSWLYAREIELAQANAQHVIPTLDPDGFASEFRATRFVDAVDLWHGLFSSEGRIDARVAINGYWPDVDRFVAVGTHVGPGTLVLRCLRAAGFRPRFVYRVIPGSYARREPVIWLYFRLRIAYMRRVSRGGAIVVPDNKHEVEQAMDETGTALVLLPDAPISSSGGRDVEIFGHRLRTATRGLELAHAKGAGLVYYSVFLDKESGRRVLELKPVPECDTPQALTDETSAWVGQTIERHPPQWQLWPTEEPILRGVDSSRD